MSLSAFSVLFATFTFSVAAFASNPSDYDAITERIKPVGNVYLAGSEPIEEEPIGPRDGETVYKTFCTACHATGVTGAPKIRNATDWAPRIAQGKAVLTEHALQGFNLMPVKGTCMNCSDEEIVAAIEHMIDGL